MTRLRIWSTMPASCVAITTVVPVRLIRSSSFMMPTEVFGSRLPVGSSAIRIIGRLTNARAIATRCCSPPDSSSGIRSPLPSRPTSSSVSGTTLLMCARGLPITCSAKATFSATVLFGSSRKSWKTVPIWRRSAGHLPAGEPVDLLAGDVDLAAGGPRLAQHQPQERRLAGAGGADEEDELALLDLDVDVVERSAVCWPAYVLVTFSNRITGLLGRARGQGRACRAGHRPSGQRPTNSVESR